MGLAARLLSGTASGCSNCKGRSVRAPVSTIACAVGFADCRYFATRFRHALGLTPTRYRQRAEGQARYEAPTARLLGELMAGAGSRGGQRGRPGGVSMIIDV